MDDLNQLIEGIETAIQLLIQSADEFIDEEFEAAAQVIIQAWQYVERQQQLSTEAPIEPPQAPGNLPPAPFDSSNIHSFGYDDKTGQLLVKFNGKDVRDDGPVYGYGGIPRAVFDLFQKGAVPARSKGQNKWGRWWVGKVPSLGASLYTLIKSQNYPYQKLS